MGALCAGSAYAVLVILGYLWMKGKRSEYAVSTTGAYIKGWTDGTSHPSGIGATVDGAPRTGNT